MTIAILIGIMIAIVVGVNLIAPVQEATKTITDATTTAIIGGQTVSEPTYSAGIRGIAGVLPIIFVAVILLASVAWIAQGGEDSGGFSFNFGIFGSRKKKVVEITVRTNSKTTINAVERASESLEPYINNLDELLGIKTIIDNTDSNIALSFSALTNELHINDEEWDWYLTAKQPNENIFKVIGLHKEDASKNVVYVLGKRNSVDNYGHDNSKAFLFAIHSSIANSEVKNPTLMTTPTQMEL